MYILPTILVTSELSLRIRRWTEVLITELSKLKWNIYNMFMFWLFSLLIFNKSLAFFDVDEITNINYGIDILDSPVMAGQVQKSDDTLTVIFFFYESLTQLPGGWGGGGGYSTQSGVGAVILISVSSVMYLDLASATLNSTSAHCLTSYIVQY